MTETPRTMVVKDPSSTLPVALRRAVSKTSATNSGGCTVVVVQHATQALASLDRGSGSKMTGLGEDEPIRQPLVIALAMIMRDEIPNGHPQPFLSEQDHPLQRIL